jgi:hypothetical protein
MDHREFERPRDFSREDEADDRYLPTISLLHLPHHKIPNLYQCCFEYVEPWQWSPVTELVETGQWFLATPSEPRPFDKLSTSREAEGPLAGDE